MRHAILGAGGIGGLLAAALAHGGGDVVLLMRPPALARYPGRMRVDSIVLGQLDVAVPAAATLEEPVDVLWVTTKATDLSAALALAPPDRVGRATVIPLLSGIDHVALMRGSSPTVLAGSIRVESERVGDGQIRQGSPFLRVEVAAAHPVTDQLAAAGIACRVHGDELTLLWDKLAFLAPVALATTALNVTLGDARQHELFRGCRDEALAIAVASGAHLDADAVRSAHDAAPAQMRSSMQKDVDAARQPEVDAIAGPILRGAALRGIPVPHTQALTDLIERRSDADARPAQWLSHPSLKFGGGS